MKAIICNSTGFIGVNSLVYLQRKVCEILNFLYVYSEMPMFDVGVVNHSLLLLSNDL